MRDTLGSLVLMLGAVALSAQEVERGAFIVRIGTDTVAVEQFARSPDRLDGRCVVRTPRTLVRDYATSIGPDGAARRFEVKTPGTTEVSTIEFDGDRAGAIPFVGNCWALLELATRRFAAGREAALKQTGIPPGPNAEPRSITLERRGRDSVTLTVIEGVPYRVALDAAGRIQGAAWAGDWTVSRVSGLDIERLAAEFTRRPLGPLSPRDSVQVTVGGATLSLNYGRPARRGRVVFGNVVPWNAVWRTGANEATLFTTSADLDVAGATIPAGRYTLWTLPTLAGWTLIVSRNTGQWGTEYDARHDLVRLPMQVERLDRPVERFTMTIEPRGEGGVLKLEWDDTGAWVAFRPKPPAGR
ncbi:MAG TPA: DUF2911 domain-containing protein [Gemmatimonadales bacterium]|nr:DUF2911 domain-containing protein [Gemmatimonadales bacterium]